MNEMKELEELYKFNTHEYHRTLQVLGEIELKIFQQGENKLLNSMKKLVIDECLKYEKLLYKFDFTRLKEIKDYMKEHDIKL